jgi:molecular chaperone DnaK
MAKRALLIANSEYEDEHFAPLPAAAADASALAEVLADPAIGEFSVDQQVNVDQRTAMRSVESFFASARPDDLLLLHVSLHGWKDLRNRLYFVARDTERAYLGATAIPAEFVSDHMGQSRCRQIVLLLDCCYSGAFAANMLRRAVEPPAVDVAEPFAGTGRVVVTASTALQFAHEGEQDVLSSMVETQPSVFTSAVVEGLRGGAADLDGDGLVSVDELYDYVHEQVRRRVPAQTPTMSVDSVQGTIHLAYSPRNPDSDLIGELRGAVGAPQSWKRIGALHLLERLLGSVRESTREAATKALLTLAADADPEVGHKARQLWFARGLGELPRVARAPRPTQRADDPASLAFGIDFGTTNSSIGVMEAGEVRLIPNAEGSVVTPSVVALTAAGPLVGEAAKRQAVTNPEHTVRSVKLRLGTDWGIEHGGRRYSAEQIAALILGRLRADAEAYVGVPMNGAILTVPAYFTLVQRHALAEAAELAGIRALRIINEPTAAAMTYGLNLGDQEQTVLMFDLGGGTFDVSLLEVTHGVCEVRATAGDNRLGGDDWDQALIDHLIGLARRQHGVELGHDVLVLQRLKEAAEAAKIDLTSASVAEVRLPYLTTGPAGPVHLDATVTRREFEALTRPVLERCGPHITRVIKDAGVTLADVDHVILVGGSTRMPAIGRYVRGLTGGKEPYRGLIPEGVVTGATLEAGVLRGAVRDILLLDVTPLTLGIQTSGGIFTKLVERNTTIPTLRTEIFTTSRDNQRTATIHVLEGEHESPDRNKTLGVMELTALPDAAGREPQIEIAFDIDANGTLAVSAQDLGSKRTVSLTIDRTAVKEATRHLQSPRWPTMVDSLVAVQPGPPPDIPAPPARAT